MTTQAQIEANRRNAQKSTGPQTPEGKARVSLNALKHGIRAKALVASLQNTPLFDDDPQAFADHVQSLVDHFHPEGPIEEACIEDIALCQWRLRRVVIAETGHIASAQTILLSGPGANNPRLRERNGLPDFDTLEKLNRYETAIQRQFKRSLDTLSTLIRERHANNQPGSNSNTKQKEDRESEMAEIRREVLGYLLDEFGSSQADPEASSVVLPEEGPNESTIEIATVATDENINPHKQSQILHAQPDDTPSCGTGPTAEAPEPSFPANLIPTKQVPHNQTQLSGPPFRPPAPVPLAKLRPRDASFPGHPAHPLLCPIKPNTHRHFPKKWN